MPSIYQLTKHEVYQLLESFVSKSIRERWKRVSDICIKNIKTFDVHIYSSPLALKLDQRNIQEW